MILYKLKLIDCDSNDFLSVKISFIKILSMLSYHLLLFYGTGIFPLFAKIVKTP